MSGVGSRRRGLTVGGVHLDLGRCGLTVGRVYSDLGDGPTESEHKASVVMLQ
jgi:hypothetical protein